MNKHNEFVEHYCIPLAFVLLNCCVIHFLFLLPLTGMQAGFYKLAVGAAGLALIVTLVRKAKWGILLASLLYTVLLLYAIFAGNAAGY